MKKIKHKPGDYEPFVQKKGVEEMSGTELKDGEVFWTVWFDNTGGFDTVSQAEAIIISKLVKIEQMLKKRDVRE
jgi:hypothetical protein